MRLSVACVLLVLGSAFSFDGQTRSSPIPQEVSLLQLIATPERYDGKLVGVKGFLHLEFEEDILYLHKEDYDQRIPQNGVWVGGNPLLKDLAHELDMHYVLVLGVFDSRQKGVASGSLKNITRASLWPPVLIPQRR